MDNSIILQAYSSLEDFLDNRPNSQVFGNSGGITSSVESWKLEKEVLGFFKWEFNNGIKSIQFLVDVHEALLKGDFKALGNIIKDHIKSFFSGLFKSTVYFYNFTQSATSINDGHLPDIIRTYGMSSVVSGENPTVGVQRALKNGLGYNLKKYYQYRTKRFKNNLIKWEAYQSKGSTNEFIKIDSEGFLKSLGSDKKLKITKVSSGFNQDGSKYEEWIQSKYGYDIFNDTPDGFEIDENLRPKEKSVGIHLWEESSSEESILPLGRATMKGKARRLPTLNQIGEYVEVLISEAFINPEDLMELDENEEGIFLDYEMQVLAKITLVDKLATGEWIYEVEEIQKTITYSKELIYWLDELGNSNHPNLSKYITIEKDNSPLNGKLNQDNSNIFRFYPYLTVKDWDNNKIDPLSEVIPYDINHPLVQAKKKISEVMDEVFDKYSEDLEVNSSTGDKTQNKIERTNYKKKHFIINNIDYYSSTDEITYNNNKYKIEGTTIKDLPVSYTYVNESESKRKLTRKITRELGKARKIKYKGSNTFQNRRKIKDSRFKKEYEYMADLLGINYVDYVHELYSKNEWRGGYQAINTYQCELMPAAVFVGQSVENANYWYEWAKYHYKLSGKEDGFELWKSRVNNSTSLKDLPLQIVKFGSEDNKFYGGYAYAFIRKITINGRTRNIKRKRRIYDILRGKPITIGSIDQLKSLHYEPLNQVSDDEFFLSSNGKEYPIGGEIFAGVGVNESWDPNIDQVFRNFSYTLFCRNTGENEITCYAVCGLQFHTKMESLGVWVQAWQDLQWEFNRLKDKYVHKKSPNDIKHYLEIENGSRKYRYVRQLHYAGIIPLDNNIIRRMSSLNLERFVQRSVLNYSWYFIETKKKRSSAKYYKPVIQVVGFIIAVVTAWFTGGQSFTAYAIGMAILQAALVTVIATVLINHILLPLLRSLGLKGLVALIVLIVIILVIMYFAPDQTTSVLPYASETTGKVGTQTGVEAVKSTSTSLAVEGAKQGTVIASQSTQSFMNTVLSGVKTQLLGKNIYHTGFNAINYSMQAMNQIYSQNINDIQAKMNKEKDLFNEAMANLESKQEELTNMMGDFNRDVVLKEFANNIIKMKDFQIIWNESLDNLGILGSSDYLSMFLDKKLDTNVETSDPLTITDFSFRS